jgi:hypothetical protein
MKMYEFLVVSDESNFARNTVFPNSYAMKTPHHEWPQAAPSTSIATPTLARPSGSPSYGVQSQVSENLVQVDNDFTILILSNIPKLFFVLL